MSIVPPGRRVVDFLTRRTKSAMTLRQIAPTPEALQHRGPLALESLPAADLRMEDGEFGARIGLG